MRNMRAARRETLIRLHLKFPLVLPHRYYSLSAPCVAICRRFAIYRAANEAELIVKSSILQAFALKGAIAGPRVVLRYRRRITRKRPARRFANEPLTPHALTVY